MHIYICIYIYISHIIYNPSFLVTREHPNHRKFGRAALASQPLQMPRLGGPSKWTGDTTWKAAKSIWFIHEISQSQEDGDMCLKM